MIIMNFKTIIWILGRLTDDNKLDIEETMLLSWKNNLFNVERDTVESDCYERIIELEDIPVIRK